MPTGAFNAASNFHSIPPNSWRTVLWVPMINPFTATGFLLNTSSTRAKRWRAFFASPPHYWEGNFNQGLVVPVGIWNGPYFQVDLRGDRSFTVTITPAEVNGTTLTPV